MCSFNLKTALLMIFVLPILLKSSDAVTAGKPIAANFSLQLCAGILACAAKTCHFSYTDHIDELEQERRNSSALAMELRLSCINSSVCE